MSISILPYYDLTGLYNHTYKTSDHEHTTRANLCRDNLNTKPYQLARSVYLKLIGFV